MKRIAVAVALVLGAVALTGCGGQVDPAQVRAEASSAADRAVAAARLSDAKVAAAKAARVAAAAKAKAEAKDKAKAAADLATAKKDAAEAKADAAAAKKEARRVVVVQPSYYSIYDVPSGRDCRDLKQAGFGLGSATDYWYFWGSPSYMDENGNGIPCEAVY